MTARDDRQNDDYVCANCGGTGLNAEGRKRDRALRATRDEPTDHERALYYAEFGILDERGAAGDVTDRPPTDPITRIPLSIVTLDGDATDGVIVAVLVADLDELERRAGEGNQP